MAYEIVGETIKSATSIKLGQIFDNPKRYKENVTKPTYPSFWIIQVNLAVTPAGIGTGRIRLDYLINIQYRVAENTENITNLRQQLDAVGLKLNAEFNYLDLELPTKVTNKNYEIVDGVGQFTFNISVFAIPETEDEPKLESYKLNEEVI